MTLLDIDRDPVCLVPGFSFSALAAGIKKNGKPDLALIAADGPVNTAAVYTRNLVRAAPVLIAEERTKRGTLRAVLINAGNANACTGKPGLEAARATTLAVSKALGCPVAEVAPASTGVIGAQLPKEKFLAAIPSLAAALSPDGAFDVARAIMTTDQWPKVAHAQIAVGRKRATVLGIAKGAGMIHPDMATTLGFVFTDAGASPALLRAILKRAVDATFNSISVDGDTSTNDTIILMASGLAGPVKANTKEAKRLEAALTEVLGDLGESIVRDGEGAQHVARIEVVGAKSDADARRAAKTIATSPLVKTAMHGKDPNWGRILAAAGRSGARFDPAQAELTIEGHVVLKRGLPLGAEAEKPAAQAMRAPKYTIRLRLGRGPGAAHYLTCDLGSAYVAVNADYRS
jgi:glutamate N-acetyltransferase/amino-acid N-acetyltransferase